jgi:uncharacterized membrane protein
MPKGRMEAFSDGVFAIILTIMVLELKMPQGPNFVDLIPLRSLGYCYVLSFIYVGIYWSNHHHLLQTVTSINGKVLWANMHLLFWLSLIPFVTAWAGEYHFASVPTASYGFVLLMAACAYTLLTRVLILKDGKSSLLATAVGRDLKGKLSIVLYILGMLLTLWHPIMAFLLYVLVAIIWFVPDKRIEKSLDTRT